MKKIPLTKGKFALVDDEDFELLNQWKWCYSHGYAQTRGRGKKEYMHRVILEAQTGVFVDHKDSDGLDNRRENLRLCTSSDNQHNRGINKNNTSGFKNIFKDKKSGRWQVGIMTNWKNYNGGFYDDIKDAVVARDKLISKLHGEFARTEKE